ncbi:MAG: ribosomal protein L7/L12 [Oscillochloridaceae bacterium umkhey_bin13]
MFFLILTGALIVAGIVVVIALGIWLAGRRREAPAFTTPIALPQLNDADQAEIELLLAQNQKIQAIKLVRERSGCGLREAKDFVEQIERSFVPSDQPGLVTSPTSAPSDELATQVRVLLAQNQKIQAVKLVHESTGWGLRESKDYVDQIERTG